MSDIIIYLLLSFFILPLLGGILAFFSGSIRPQFQDSSRALAGWHPLNPYYKLSPYHFGKRS